MEEAKQTESAEFIRLNHKNTFWVVIFVLFLMLLSGISGYLIGIKSKENIKSKSVSQPTHATVSPTEPLFTQNPTATPFPIPFIDASSWQTYSNTTDGFTMRYPGNLQVQDVVTYEGGDTEKYLTDSVDSIKKWQSNNDNMLTNQNIIIQPLKLSFEFEDENHRQDEKMQKIMNTEYGVSILVGKNQIVPWVNANGGTYDGRHYFYLAPIYAKLTIDGKPATRIKTKDAVIYTILIGNTNLKLRAYPPNSLFIPIFDKMVSTLRFTNH